MRAPLPLLLCLSLPVLAAPAATPAWAAPQHHTTHAAVRHAAAPPKAEPSAGPKAIGKFEDWEAATHPESGQTVCYAFTRATSSNPRLPGRGDVVLTVTQRPTGRDAVAISTGYAYPANAEVMVQVEQSSFPFYTAGRSAFARNGHAAVEAFLKGRQVTARAPGPQKGQQVTDTFPLRGFNAAYQAINKACPAH